MSRRQTQNEPAAKRSYAGRWIGEALTNTWRIFRGHLAVTAISLVGAAAAIFLVAPLLLGPDSGALVSQELTLAALAAVGSVVLVLFAVLLWSLLTAPVAMERYELAAEGARTTAAEAERDRLATELAELRGRIDHSRLRVEVANDSDPLRPLENSNAAMTRFIQSEDHALTDEFRVSGGKKPGGGPLSAAYDSLHRETRSAEDYIVEVREYLTAISQKWDRAIAAAAIDQGVAQLLLTVHNTGDIGYAGVEVEVTLPEGWNAGWEEGDLWEDDHPDRPAVWGSKTLASITSSITPISDRRDADEPGTIRERPDGVRVRWKSFDLPADRDQMLAPVRLSIPESYAGQSMALRWTAASASGGRPVEGTVGVRVSATSASAAELLLPREDD